MVLTDISLIADRNTVPEIIDQFVQDRTRINVFLVGQDHIREQFLQVVHQLHRSNQSILLQIFLPTPTDINPNH